MIAHPVADVHSKFQQQIQESITHMCAYCVGSQAEPAMLIKYQQISDEW